jgi:fermentation-respiration switch protein FrsA (DUF1100 family)
MQKESVHFYSHGEKIVGDLYFPTGSNTAKRSAIVVITPWGGVKEQTAGIYAKKLTEQGFITLAFDHHSYGQSEGVPRCNEDPWKKVDDIKNAVTFLSHVDGVDSKAIAALGICSGAAYVAYAAATNQDRIHAIATISGYFHDLYQRRYLVDAVGKQGVNDLMIEARQAKAHYLKTGEAKYVPHIPEVDENSLEIVKDFYSYYCTARGKTPSYVGKTLLSSLEQLGAFSAIAALKAYASKPSLFVVGEQAKSAYESEDALNAISGNTSELFVIPGANHTDLYDGEQYVNQAINKLADFYHTALHTR